jgi:acyl-CoA thioester hydrolase
LSSAAERFEVSIQVEPEDIDEQGHVNNTVYLRWVQDAATAHWRARAPAEVLSALTWVVLRHEIDYLRPALPGERLRARTWVGSAEVLRFERHTEILRERDGYLLARARTIWCPINTVTGRPQRTTAEVRSLFSVVEPPS